MDFGSNGAPSNFNGALAHASVDARPAILNPEFFSVPDGPAKGT
jgi:hypothetical protein